MQLKIQPKNSYIKPNLYSTKNKNWQNTANLISFKSKTDTVEISNNAKTNSANKAFHKFKAQKGRVSKKEYEKIKKEAPELIACAREYIEQNGFNSEDFNPKLIAKTATNLKKVFDERYKEGYQLISIGTSPAPIAEAIEILGCDVSYMPITNARYWLPEINRKNQNNVLINFPNLEKSLNYVKKQKKLNAKDDRKILIMDFCASGATLRNVGKMITYYFKIPIEKVNFIDLLEEIRHVNQESNINIDKFSQEELRKIMQYLANSWIEDISNVPHYPIKPLGKKVEPEKPELYSKGNFKNFNNPLGRAFGLCVIDELNEIQKKSETHPGLML